MHLYSAMGRIQMRDPERQRTRRPPARSPGGCWNVRSVFGTLEGAVTLERPVSYSPRYLPGSQRSWQVAVPLSASCSGGYSDIPTRRGLMADDSQRLDLNPDL